MKIYHEKLELEVYCRKVRWLERGIGLTFKTRETKALLFNVWEGVAITSWFVFFSFYAVWLDKNNNIIKIDLVKPFTYYIAAPKESKLLLEVPISKRYCKENDFLKNIK